VPLFSRKKGPLKFQIKYPELKARGKKSLKAYGTFGGVMI
jgi:hypothetical protein